VDAERRFRESVILLGAVLAPGATYKNNSTPVQLICGRGHTCNPRPGAVQQGRGICPTCADQGPAAAAAFWARVAELGGKPAPGAVYCGSGTPVRLICKLGHACKPSPTNVQKGRGVCGECAVSFDRVYLVKHVATGAIKVGVSSVDGRVNVHVGHGYKLVAQWLGLTHTQAREVEKAAHAFWRDRGWPAVADAPKDGWTETVGLEHLGDTQIWMTARLGPGTRPEPA